jgi:hypothetical protein
MSAPLVPDAFDHSADGRVVLAMCSIGATSAAHARPLAELPPEIAARLDELVDRGLVREGAPGTYYLFVSTRAPDARMPDGRTPRPLPAAPRPAWQRAGLVFLFWVLIILAPIVYLQLTARRR